MKGILFKPDAIKLIPEGKKTVTRRLGGLKEINKMPNDGWRFKCVDNSWYASLPTGYQTAVKPRYQVGEIVYIKEAWRPYSEKEVKIEYKLDGAIIDYPGKPDFMFYACGQSWHSPLFMPEWAARHFIKILDARPERLQEITESDIISEGCPEFETLFNIDILNATRFHWYQDLWDFINPQYPFSSNPYVWRYKIKYLKEYK